MIYFVTICVANRRCVLANEKVFKAFKIAVAKLHDWTVLAALLMPDHLHAIIAPVTDRDAKIGNFAGALERWIRKELAASWKWEPGSFDRLLRSDESLHDKWVYVYKKTPFEPDSLRIGRIGPTKLDWMNKNEM